jgi:hypothetical protein
MYSVHAHPVQTMSNGGIGNGIMDPTGTIDPSALNAAGTLLVSHVVALHLRARLHNHISIN